MGATIPLTATLAADQRKASHDARSMQDYENYGKGTTLETQDEGPVAQYVIYIYNLLEVPHTVNLPPNFPAFLIPACESGKDFAYTIMPAFVRNKFNRSGTYEHYTQREDGRKAAGQILNPGSFPTTLWDSQLADRTSYSRDNVQDQFGNNLNNYGCFWSLVRPDDPDLRKQIDIFKKRWMNTVEQLIRNGSALYASKKEAEISPMMHFAMDYAKRQAPWHQSHQHMIACPNCGMHIMDGLAYHRNEFGEKCIVDEEKCRRLGVLPPLEIAPAPAAQAVASATQPPVTEEMPAPEIQGAADEANIFAEENEILAMATRIRAKRAKKKEEATEKP